MDEIHKAEVTPTDNGFVSNTKPLEDIPQPELSNTTDKSLQDLIAEYIKNNELKTDNAPTSNNISNLTALIQGAQDLYKTKRKLTRLKMEIIQLKFHLQLLQLQLKKVKNFLNLKLLKICRII